MVPEWMTGCVLPAAASGQELARCIHRRAGFAEGRPAVEQGSQWPHMGTKQNTT